MTGVDINFFSEGITFNLKNKTLFRKWLFNCAASEKKTIESLNYIFCSDNHLKKINRQYLKHNYFTDIITFPSSEKNVKNISGDIFISIERVKENAQLYKVVFADELKRVMAHGLLHMCGYRDKSEKEIAVMRKKETSCIALFKKFV